MDKNFYALPQQVDSIDTGDLIPSADFAPWSDTLKGSAACGPENGVGMVNAGIVQGGQEDCCDLNNGSQRLRIYAKEWRSGGTYVTTQKGHLRDIEIGGLITRHGSVVDVDIDNYSDQSHRASENIRLNFTTNDGSPVTWRSWRGCKPVILNPEQKYVCKFCLPAWVGFILNTFYQVAKVLRLTK